MAADCWLYPQQLQAGSVARWGQLWMEHIQVPPGAKSWHESYFGSGQKVAPKCSENGCRCLSGVACSSAGRERDEEVCVQTVSLLQTFTAFCLWKVLCTHDVPEPYEWVRYWEWAQAVCVKVCQLFAVGQCCPPGAAVSSTSETAIAIIIIITASIWPWLLPG